MRLLLFDIDGTLLTSGGAGEQALRDAMKARFGEQEDLKGIVLAGATDAAIARELLSRKGIDPSADNVAGLIDSYTQALHERMATHQGSLLPGIVELLDLLHKRDDCVLGLLTGNVRRGAEIKLTHFGVWDYFEFGAFADDHHDRNELGPVAQGRAVEAHGRAFEPQQIYVIGDTPRDIECAKVFGAHAVAIATGNYSKEELAAHRPEFLFQDLSDSEAVISALFSEPNSE